MATRYGILPLIAEKEVSPKIKEPARNKITAGQDSKGVLERTGIVMGAGNLLVVYSNQAGVSAVAFGIETST